MRQVHGLFDSFEICRDLSRDGNSFFIDDGSPCGVVYFPNVRTLRKIANALKTVPNGRLSRECGQCTRYLDETGSQACVSWISNLLKGVVKMFIPVKMPGDLFSKKSYIAKVDTIECHDTIRRDFFPLRQTFYKSGLLCELEIDPSLVKVGDYLALKLIWGKAVDVGIKDENKGSIRIKESYYRVESDPKESKSFLECLKHISYHDLKTAFNVRD